MYILCKDGTDFNSERACSQKVVNIDDSRAEEGSDKFLPGGRGGKAPGEDAQEGVQQAEEEAALTCVISIRVGHPQEATDANGDTGSVKCVCSTRALECR